MEPVSLLFGVVIGVVIGADLMACVASWRTVPAEPKRDSRGRFVKELSVKQPSRWIAPDPDLSPDHYANLFLPGIRGARGKGKAFDEIREAMGCCGHLDSANGSLGFTAAVERVKASEELRP